ncbi:MAG: hypothetical protein CSA38_01495 [Flavobacteriales bacterium]|nr:MAG: hypothetical protein CSA38_01495 [Flavobacteriales bacterium]
MINKVSTLFFGILSTIALAQQSLSIDDAWQYAVDHNVEIQKAKINQQIAKHKVNETIGIGLPQINAQGKYNYFLELPTQLLPAEIMGGPRGVYVPVQFGQKHTATGGISLRQLIFNGSYIVGLESSKAYRETSDLVAQKTRLSIKQGVLLAYTAVLVMEENLITLEENRRTVAKSLNDMKKTYELGLVEFQNVEQLEYSYKTLITNIENLKRTKEKLLMSLKYVIGYPLNETLTLTSTLKSLIQKNEVLVDTEKNDVQNHIDFKLKKNVLRLSKLKLKLEKSKALPSLTGFISTSYNGNSNEFSFFDKDQKWFNTSVVGLQLDIPIFSGLQRSYKTQQAKLEVKKAEMDLDNTQRKLQNDLKSAQIDYENAYNSFNNAKELIQLSSSIYHKQQIKFKEGLGTSFELQQAENQLYKSQTKYYNSALSLIQAKTKLDQALGKL